jgi:hypothetical protein
MMNDADIEMWEAAAASDQGNRQRHGRVATSADIEEATSAAASSLWYSGGESSHSSMLEAVEDRQEVAWTSEVRERIQWDAWHRYERRDAAENGDQS